MESGGGDRSDPGFSLVRSGLFYRLQRSRGVIRHDGRDPVRRAALFAGVTWLPIVVLGGVELLVLGTRTPLLHSFRLHVQLLIAPVLLFLADDVIHDRTAVSLQHLEESGLVDEAHARTLREIMAWAARLSGSTPVEVMLLSGAFLLSVPHGLAGRWDPGEPAHGWYVAVALPLFRFLLLRRLWIWLLWMILLGRVSRLHLRLDPVHPDRAGGLGFLVAPCLGFTPVVLAMSSTVAAAWGDLIVFEGARLPAFYTELVAFVGLMLLLSLGPLGAFTVQLTRLRWQGVREFGGLALRHDWGFREKWIRRREEDPLGNPDMSSLVDLGSDYLTVERTRVVPFGRSAIFTVLASALAPMLPLVFLEIGLSELLGKLAGAVLQVSGPAP